MNLLRALAHRLAHTLRRNGGRVVTWQDRNGRFMVGFFCLGCSRVYHAHEMPRHVTHPEEFDHA